MRVLRLRAVLRVGDGVLGWLSGRRKAPVERIRTRNIRMAALKPEHEFLKRDAVCISDSERPGRKEFVYEGPWNERQLRWRRCSFHRAETRLLRRSTIETKDLEDADTEALELDRHKRVLADGREDDYAETWGLLFDAGGDARANGVGCWGSMERKVALRNQRFCKLLRIRAAAVLSARAGTR